MRMADYTSKSGIGMATSFALRGLIALGVGMSAVQAAEIRIVPTDAPGEGFFDPTPFTPEGGNNATTLGEARLNVFRAAAEQWGAIVASDVEIMVEASFAPAPETECAPSSGTLGAAGPGNFIAGFRGAPQANTFYPVALANALAGEDLDPGFADIVASFNGAVDTDPNCLTGVRFYYGFDHQGGSRAVDFYNTVMHEIGHGLGFVTLVGDNGRNLAAPGFMVLDRLIFDNDRGLFWDEMSNARRSASVINERGVVNAGNASFSGARARGLSAGNGTDGAGRPLIYTPNPAEPGSSLAHWDTQAQPSLLMEPFSTADIRVHTGVDLTSCLLRDIGWRLEPGVGCPDQHAPDTPPEISAIADRSTETGRSTGAIAFTVTDNARATPADNLSLRAFSDNPAVVPDSGIVLGGSGANRSIEITAGATPGRAGITVVVSDGIFTARTGFEVTVTEALNQPPLARDDLVRLFSSDIGTGNVLTGIASAADSDPDGDTVQVVAINGDAAAVGAALVTAQGSTLRIEADGALRYAPGGDMAALQPSRRQQESVRYTIADRRGASDSALVTIEVTGDPGTDQHGGSAQTATPLSLTDAERGFDAAINVAGDADVFGFTLASTATVFFATEGDTDTVGRVRNLDGVVLAEGDDHAESDSTDPNFVIEQQLPAGAYRLTVTGFQNTATGNYRLRYSARAEALPDPVPEPPADPEPVDESADPPDPDDAGNGDGQASPTPSSNDAVGASGGGSFSPWGWLGLTLVAVAMRYRRRHGWSLT